MAKWRSTVQFAKELHEEIQTAEKDLINEDKEALLEQIEEEEEDVNFKENEDLPIQIEYTTTRDSFEKNRCLVTPKPPRRHVPLFWKRGTDSGNIGYILKTNFIGDTKIVSVAHTEKQEQFDTVHDFNRHSFIGRSIVTLKREASISNDTLNNYETRTESLAEYVRNVSKKDRHDYTENLNESKRAISKIERMIESYTTSFGESLFSARNRYAKSDSEDQIDVHSEVISKSYSQDVSKRRHDSEDHQIDVYTEVTSEYNSQLEDDVSKRTSQGSMEKPIADNNKGIKIENNSELQDVDDQIRESIPLEKKWISMLQYTNPKSELIHYHAPLKELKKPKFIEKTDIIPPEIYDQLVERQEKSHDSFKISPSISTFRKLPPKTFSSQNINNQDIKESLKPSHEAPKKAEVHKKLKESVSLLSKKTQKDTGSLVTNDAKSDEHFSINDEKQLIVTNSMIKPPSFGTDRFVFEDGNKFLKRPIQLSLKIIENSDGKSDYKVIATKSRFGMKKDYDIFMKQFKVPKGLQELPQLTAPRTVKSIQKVASRESKTEEQHLPNETSKSSKAHGQVKLPYLNKSFTTSALQQAKNNTIAVISHMKPSPSLLVNKSQSLVKTTPKPKLKAKLSLKSNLSRLNEMKKQIPSQTELLGSNKTKMTKSESKTSHLFEVNETFKKKSDTLLNRSYVVDERKHSPDEAGTKQHAFKGDRTNESDTLDHSYNIHGPPFIGIAKQTLPAKNLIEQDLLKQSSVSSGVTPDRKNVNGEETDMATSYTSTISSDILMNIDSESLQNIMQEYLLNNLTYGEEEMEKTASISSCKGNTKYIDDKIGVHPDQQSQKFDYNYRGTHDVHNLRSGFGCFHWDALESRTYCGYFLYNSLHGKGHYFIKEDKCLNFYNGNLYSNALYGYGQIVHENGQKFEGLFKNNTRYGPGILTHTNGNQDVGMWYGNSLIRINIDLSRYIPSFGRSVFGKIKLLNFKRSVRLKTHNKEKTREILEHLTPDSRILSRWKELYNPYVRNQNSLFYNRSDYDDEFFKDEECYVVIHKNLHRHKNVTDSSSVKFTEENAGKISEEQAELMRTIENIQTKLTNFRTQIEELQTREEIELLTSESVTRPALDDAQKNKLYKEELFYSSVLEFLNHKLNRYNQVSSSGQLSVNQKVRVNSLLAWNNDELLVDMLLHTFRCRSSENNVSFEVKSITKGERKPFGPPGENEVHCIEFLESCRTGDDKKVLSLLLKANLNPDVSDSKGNTGLHFATRFDHVSIIEILANNGAKLNSTNDEGLIPLNLALLRYLELIYHVRRWEFGFLSQHEVSSTEKRRFSEWIPYESYWISILITPAGGNRRPSYFNVSESARNVRQETKSKKSRLATRSAPNPFLKLNSSKLFKDLIPELADPFVFSLEYKRKHSNAVSTIASNSHSNESQQESSPSNEIKRRLDGISESIETLLHYGAELIDSMPFHPFFIALFTKSSRIIESFLEHNADPNRLYQGMTPLQIICCLELSEELCIIVDMMIQYGADVNILSDNMVWRECDNYLIRDVVSNDVKPQGKNALHFLCLRESGNTVLCRIAEMLLLAGTKTDFLYQGHSHLSMAVLQGNTDLIRSISKFVDISRSLGNGLGNALTVLALRRYPYMIHFRACKDVIDCLFELGISPFESLYNYSNIFEFFDHEWPPSIGEKIKSWNTYAASIKKYQKLIKKARFRHIRTKCNMISKTYIRDKSRSILDVIIRYKAVLYLYNFFKEMHLNKNTVRLAKMIGSSDNASVNLEVIFRCEKLPQSWFSTDIITRLFEYVDEINKNKKKEKTTLHIEFDSRKKEFKYLCECSDIYPIAKWVNDENLYRCEVCYFCMHKKDKILLKCPLCGIVNFCSERCNYLSNKFRTIHVCSEHFYQDVFKEYKLFINKREPIPLYGIELDLENARKR